jgi:hypothetical protein
VLEEVNRWEARADVQNMRSKGIRAFAEHNDEKSYSRAFVHEQDEIKQGILSRPLTPAEFLGILQPLKT